MKLKFIHAFVVILFIAPALYSSSMPPRAEEPLTLEQCLNQALENNHLLKSFHQELRASRARVNQAKAFPQPEISFDSDLQPKVFQFGKSGEHYLGVSQLIEFPGRRYLRGKIARKEHQMVELDTGQARLDIIYNVKRTFYQLLLAMETHEYAKQNLSMAKDYFTRANERYRSGQVAKFEMLRAKVEAARTENQLKVAANNVKLARAELNFFLARHKARPTGIRGKLRGPFQALDLKRLQAKALAHRPDIKKEQAAVSKESLAKKQALLSYLPDVSLGVSRHHIDFEPDTWDVSLSFQVPLFFWQKAKGEVAEARANREAAKQRLKHTRLAVSLEVENAYYNALSLRNQITLYEKEILEEAQEVYRMSMISYREGKIGGIELIEARRALVDIKGAYAETLFNHQLALADLEKSLGLSTVNAVNTVNTNQ